MEEELQQRGGPRLFCFAMLQLRVYGDIETVNTGVMFKRI